MSESNGPATKQYGLIVEVADEELLELRNFNDPELDLEQLEGFN